LDFGSGEPLDDLHRSTAVRAAIKVGGVSRGGSVFFSEAVVVPLPRAESKAGGA